MRVVTIALLGLGLTACTSTPPPRWQQGGAPLVLPTARWDRPDAEPVQIEPDGRVLEGGELMFVIDRVGRVVDPEYEPVAVLFPDGRLAGADHHDFGQVGVTNAAPSDRHNAWLTVTPDGTVLYFDEDGERHRGGLWAGCAGPALRTCTLVTHLVTVRHYARSSDPAAGVGVGVGIGIGF